MSVRLKLMVIILFVALVPLTVSALSALGIHQTAFERNLVELHRRTAESAAARLQAQLDGVSTGLGSLALHTITWSELTAAERDAALWLVYRQSEDVSLVLLVDEQRRPIAPPAYVGSENAAEEPAHPRARAELARELVAHLPRPNADTTAFGEVIVAPDTGSALLPIAFQVRAAPPASKWTVAVALDLRGLCRRLGQSGEFELTLADRQGRPLCAVTGPALPAGLMSGLAQSTGVAAYTDAAGRELVAAAGAVGPGWQVVAAQPAAVARAAGARIQRQSRFWMALSLVVALAAGLLLSRSISRPIERLVAGTRALAEGKTDHRIGMQERDEFGRLSAAFDQMGEAIAVRDAEIRGWNQELQQRVEARSAELERAHDRLLHSEKVAATAMFSARVASEVNDPLTAVLGIVQLVRGRAGKDPARTHDAELLEKAEQQAQRIRAVMRRLQTLAQSQESSRFALVRANDLLDSTVELLRPEITQKQLQLVKHYVPDLPTVAGNFMQLQQAILQVLSNAVSATRGQPTLELSTATAGDMVRIVVEDHGCGILPTDLPRVFEPFFTTKDASEGAGLGLTIAQRIIEQHHGSIGIESRAGEGTTVTVQLPVMK